MMAAAASTRRRRRPAPVQLELVVLLRKALRGPANGPLEGLRSRATSAIVALSEDELRIVVAFVESLDPSIPFGR